MKIHTEEPRRRSIRLRGHDYATPGAYLTIVTHGRAPLFGEIQPEGMKLSDLGRTADECWRLIPQHAPNAELGAFVVMPNHLHGILILHAHSDASTSERRGTMERSSRGTTYRAPTSEQFQKPVAGSIPTIVRTYKAAVTRKIARQHGGAPEIWQRNYYEHVIRNEEEHSRVQLYIESNVANWAADSENPKGALTREHP